MHRSLLVSVFFLAFFNIFASAALHSAALCVNYMNSAVVINAAATEKACGFYSVRNKGPEQWNTCSECKTASEERSNDAFA